MFCNRKPCEGHEPLSHLGRARESLARLDEAFDIIAARADLVEAFHHAVNAPVREVVFALYRDFPDPAHRRGEERF